MQMSKWLAAIALAGASLAAQAVGRNADVTIMDRASGRALPVYWHEGRAYVVGRPGAEYQVRVRNRLGDDLLAVVSVDGVNVLDGRTAHPLQGGYVVPARQRTDILGWRKNLDETAAFYFTDLEDSYADRTGRPDDVGVIGVALFERAQRRWREQPRWDKREAAPPSAPQAKRMPGAPLGTGHGAIDESPVDVERFERASDQPVETVAIYYDSYRNLVAQGVIPWRGYGRRDPDPFPSTRFVPDPPVYRR